MTADLMDIARSLGGTSVVPSTSQSESERTLDQWFARAEGRPAFMLWGKAHDGQPWPMHPLVCHVLDVAAVAALLLARVMSPALRERLLACDPDRERGFRSLLFIVALHDLGKATPAFQHKRPEARAPLQARGFDLERVKPQDRHHGDIGFWLLRDALKSRGSGTSATKLARAVAAHHGEFPHAEMPARRLRAPGRLGGSSAHAEMRPPRRSMGRSSRRFLRPRGDAPLDVARDGPKG
jgi:CRISPR-associated endonuclease Cas3-HD